MPRRPSRSINLYSLFAKNPIGVSLFIIGAIAGYFSYEQLNPQWQGSSEPSQLNVCFTPGTKCTSLIIQEIRKAKSTIRVQAYSFTSQPIATALIEMAQKGVKVAVLVDRSQLGTERSVVSLLKTHRIPVSVDTVPGIAHNKIIIIDNDSLITGSFNFSSAAEDRNAENVLLIKDPVMVTHYLKNWEKRTPS